MAQLNEDERICQERHGNLVDFHEACHTCWKHRALKAERTAARRKTLVEKAIAFMRDLRFYEHSHTFEDLLKSSDGE